MLSTVGLLVLPFLLLLVFARVTRFSAAELFADLWTSMLRLAAAYVIAAVLAWILAVLFYRGKRSIVALPVFDVLQSFPTFAALPIAISFWGDGNVTVIVFLVITIIWPIFFTILSSLKLARHDWQEAVTIYRLRPLDHLRLYLWPLTIPGLVTGSIIGLGEGWEALVATEIIVKTYPGLGSFFQAYADNGAISALGILGLLILIFGINKALWLPLLDWSHDLAAE